MTGSQMPENLRYTRSHEWVRREGEEVVVGITDHAQQELTDVVFVDLPKVGAESKSGGTVLVVESVKTVADVYAPFSGRIVAVNESLKQHPELVNRAPYGEGWLFRLKLDPSGQPDPHLSAADYEKFVQGSLPTQ